VEPWHQTHLLKELSPSQAWPHAHPTTTGALWQLQGVLEWSYLSQSPPKFLTPYHELVARLIAKGCTCCCELLGHEPSNFVVLFSKDQLHWLWQFLDLWQSAPANFPGQVGNISCIQNFYCLPPFVYLPFQKLFYPPLCRKLSQFSLMLLGVVLLHITPKTAMRLNILFLPPLKGWSFMLLSIFSLSFVILCEPTFIPIL
jgi:hypothetical protein